MYRLSVQEFLYIISKGLKRSINEDDVFSNKIELAHLKRIDKLFEKGIHYYIDPKSPENKHDASVFFRKEQFETELNIRAKKVVSKFEELKISISAIRKLSDIDTVRNIGKYDITDNPRSIAIELRKILYPKFTSKRRDFLKLLISKFADNNIMVFEFIEVPNRKEKANIDGFFLKPDVIVIKRHQSFRREIFTLIHELGHYILGEEEIEQLDYDVIANKNLSLIERWCNDFAYFFLVGEYDSLIEGIKNANKSNDYCFSVIENISVNTHLSQIALFTRLLYQNKISKSDYKKIKNNFDESFAKFIRKKEIERQLLKQEGRKQLGSIAKPITSPLFVSTIQSAFYEGVINEYEVCKKLNIKPDKLEKYI